MSTTVVPTIKGTSTLPLDEAVGQTLGRYKLLEQLGEGGCGVVYVAEQTEPVRRRVALKVIKLGMDTKSVVARFEAERQALAMMDHPNIAKVLDAGTTGQGRPYFVMELVRGVRITDYSDQNRLTTDERVELFIQVCQAIQHAHQKGIIHRDIKPSNILVTMHDGVPVPKVIDFGIAKATEGRLTDATVYTQLHHFIGTPAYMSPEQAEMSGLDVDTRSDIYSLGVLLYELLTGRTPFDPKELVAHGIDEIRKTIREKDPVRPSTRLATLGQAELTTTAKRRSVEASRLTQLLRGDLDWIVMKCLEKDRTRRYETANGLAMDLKRHLVSEPVTARPPTALYRVQKAFLRNKLAFAAGSAVLCALVIGAIISTWQASVATRARHQAQQNLNKALVAEAQVQKALGVAETQRDRALQVAAELRLRNYVADVALANAAIENGDLGRAELLLQRYLASEANEADLRGFEWHYLWSRIRGNYEKEIGPYHGFLNGVALSPDGQFVALNNPDASGVEIRHLKSGTVAKLLQVGPDEVCPLTFSSAGKVLLGRCRGQMLAWDTGSWATLDSPKLSFPIAFGRQGEHEIMVGCDGEHLSLWDVTEWKKLGDLANTDNAEHTLLVASFGGAQHMANSLAVSSENHIAYLAVRSAIRRWDLTRMTELAPLPTPNQLCVATSQDGQLATSDGSGKVSLLDPNSGRILHTFAAHQGWVSRLKFSQDGSRLYSASADRNVVVYDPGQFAVLNRLLGHKTEIWGMDVAADGKSLVAGSAYGGQVLAWSLPALSDAGSNLADLDLCHILSDGKILFHHRSDPDLEYYDPLHDSLELAQARRFTEKFLQYRMETVAMSPNGAWVLARYADKEELWSAFAGVPEDRFSSAGSRVYAAAFSPDSKRLVTAHQPLDIRIWKSADWSSVPLCEKGDYIYGIAFSGDSRRVGFSGTSGRVRVFDLLPEPREIAFDQQIPNMECYSIALSTSGRWLAVGNQDNGIYLWDLELKKQLPALRGHIQGVWRLSFSPDDRTLASSSGGDIVLWNVASWQQLLSASEPCGFLQFSPDGRYLASLNQETPRQLRLRTAPLSKEARRRTLRDLSEQSL